MAKKKNFISRYFKNFSLKQVSEILLFVGLVALVVSLFFTEEVEFAQIFMGITLGVVALAFALCIIYNAIVLSNKKLNHRSPEYKQTVVALVFSAIAFAVCLFGCLYALLTL